MLTSDLFAVANLDKSSLKPLKHSADLQLYDSEFQTRTALILKAFADNTGAIRLITVKVQGRRAGGDKGDMSPPEIPMMKFF